MGTLHRTLVFRDESVLISNDITYHLADLTFNSTMVATSSARQILMPKNSAFRGQAVSTSPVVHGVVLSCLPPLCLKPVTCLGLGRTKAKRLIGNFLSDTLQSMQELYNLVPPSPFLLRFTSTELSLIMSWTYHSVSRSAPSSF